MNVPLADSEVNTLVGANCAVFIIAVFLQQMKKLPGKLVLSHVIPVTASVFGLLILGLILSRLEYSRVLLVASFIITLLWYAIRYSLRKPKTRVEQFLVVPYGTSQTLLQFPGHWRVLSRPPEEPIATQEAIVVDTYANLPNEWADFIANCVMNNRTVYDATHLREGLTGQIALQDARADHLDKLFIHPLRLWTKRLLDIVAALALLIITIPVSIMIAIAVKLTSKGPVLYIGLRVGQREKPFKMVKFRSMSATPTKQVTFVGRFIRAFRLDELPQLWNVLKGDMSLIGPRPEDQSLHDTYKKQIPYYRYKYMIKPGITGWAQVMHGHTHAVDIDAIRVKLEYDLYYIKYCSYWLDINIALRTIGTILLRYKAN